MKKLVLVFVALFLVVAATVSSSAQGKMSLSVGGDVLVPTGDFSTFQSVGFGGSARGQYDFTPELGCGLTLGYYTWAGKDVDGFTKPTFSGVPVRVYGKYYFMPGKGPRVYGMLELGIFFWSESQDLGGSTVGNSGSDFNYCPGLGVEIPAGIMKMDLSARYDAIGTSVSSKGSLAIRVGLNFAVGN